MTQYTTKTNSILDTDQIPQDPTQLQASMEQHKQLLSELDDLEVQTKMMSDWSVEIGKGPNPSCSVDEAVELEEKLIILRKQLDNKYSNLNSIQLKWINLNNIINNLSTRINNINILVQNLKSKLTHRR